MLHWIWPIDWTLVGCRDADQRRSFSFLYSSSLKVMGGGGVSFPSLEVVALKQLQVCFISYEGYKGNHCAFSLNFYMFILD